MRARVLRLRLAKGLLRVEVALLRLVEWLAGTLGAATPTGTWGAVDPTRHAALAAKGHDLRVYVGGVDVTRRVRFFDDRPGRRRAELYVLGDDGRVALNPATRAPAVEVVDLFEVRAT